MKQKQSISIINYSAHFRDQDRTFCPHCRKPVGLMLLSGVTSFYKTEVRKIYLLIHRGILHPVQNRRGELMICRDSLAAYFEPSEAAALAWDQRLI